MALPRREEGDEADGKVADLRVLRPRRAPPAEAARVTRAEIDLAHVRHNLHELEATLAADSAAAARVWAVLKADGYGHGAAAVGRTLEQAGVAGLCVALLEEGIELRNAGVACPILVMGGYYGRFRDGVEALIENELTPVVYSADQMERIASTLRFVRGDAGRQAVHLKVDTGMGRLGVREAELPALLATLRANPSLRLDGLMTHLACADSTDLAVTAKQLADFERVTALVRQAGFKPRVRHAANSAAMLRLPEAQLDLVRPGIAIFGVHPCPAQPSSSKRKANLKPVMRVLSEVVALRDVARGDAIGYGHSWRAQRPSRIATIPIGYADGLDRALSNRGEVLICGRRAPIVGTVSMDLTMVDVTDLADVGVRDEVVVLGWQRGRLGEDTIGAHELADKTGTIPWECLTAISRRVPRFYRHP
jgi:alanine racemase